MYTRFEVQGEKVAYVLIILSRKNQNLCHKKGPSKQGQIIRISTLFESFNINTFHCGYSFSIKQNLIDRDLRLL